METFFKDTALIETPEKRAQKTLTVKGALWDMLHTDSRGAYLRHYDKDSLSAILTAIEGCKRKDEARAYYKALNVPVKFQLLTIEKRSRKELNMIQKLVDTPNIKIFESVNRLSV